MGRERLNDRQEKRSSFLGDIVIRRHGRLVRILLGGGVVWSRIIPLVRRQAFQIFSGRAADKFCKNFYKMGVILKAAFKTGGGDGCALF